MLKRLAAMFGALLFAAGLGAPLIAHAQPKNISQTVGVCDPNYPANCLKPAADGSIAVTGGGGGGGGASVTATAAAPTLVEGSTTNNISANLKGGIRFLPITPTGTNIDLSLPSSIMGLDGSTIMGASNPVASQLTAGTAIAGKFGVDQTTPGTTNAVAPTPTTGMGCTLSGTQSAASTNATNVKASAATLCGGQLLNTNATIYYVRFYNLAAAPTCSSATGFVMTVPVPVNATSGGGVLLDFGAYGGAFTTGLSFCVTGGPTSTDNTNAATGVFINLAYK